jgi:DNA-binding XRE family transcriptional regulator
VSDLEGTVREHLGHAYRYGLAAAMAAGGAPLGYPEEARGVAAVLAAACAPRLGKGPAQAMSGIAARRAVGERIRQVREAAGMEQRVLAAHLDTSQAAVSRWETGERDPGVAGLVLVAGVLGVTAASLLPGEGGGSGG